MLPVTATVREPGVTAKPVKAVVYLVPEDRRPAIAAAIGLGVGLLALAFIAARLRR